MRHVIKDRYAARPIEDLTICSCQLAVSQEQAVFVVFLSWNQSGWCFCTLPRTLSAALVSADLMAFPFSSTEPSWGQAAWASFTSRPGTSHVEYIHSCQSSSPLLSANFATSNLFVLVLAGVLCLKPFPGSIASAVFMDLQKAYDSVPHAVLWRALEKLGVPDTMIRLVQ